MQRKSFFESHFIYNNLSLNYQACDGTRPDQLNNYESLACAQTTTECNESKKCFPKCCDGLKFDFTSDASIIASENSDCFKNAPHLIEPLNDKDNLIGQYIYHYSSASCKKIGGIINPKCCNRDVAYNKEDPCYCHGTNSYYCSKISYDKCTPINSDYYPACCYDIGNNLFG